MRIVYMGTPDFAVPSLRMILEEGHTVPLVITRPDQQRDRGKKLKPTPVKALAEERGIPVISPETLKRKDEEGRTLPGLADSSVMELLREASPDCIVVAAYGQILPKEILDLPSMGCINVHGSLLPRWRGAAPVQRAIEAGDSETGVTIMYMGEELDTGDMLSKVSVSAAGKTAGELTDELAEKGALLLLSTLDKLEKGLITPEKQDDSLSTYAKMVFKKDGLLSFSKSAEELERRIRAMSPWPGAYAYYEQNPIKILKASPLDKMPPRETPMGTILAAGKSGVEIACRKGEDGFSTEILNALWIQMPGKKALPTEEFFKGNSLHTGTVLTETL